MSRLRLAVAAALASSTLAFLAAAPSRALACSPDTVDISRVVGFQEDGHYVTFKRHWTSFDEGIADESFTLHDENGNSLSTLVAEWDEAANVTRWRSRGTAFFDGLAGADDEAAKIEKVVIAAKELTSSTKRRKVRHVKSERVCGSVELKTQSGWVRVHERQEDYSGGCVSYGFEAFEHPKTNVVFVRAKHKSRNADFSTEVDVLIELPQQKAAAIELALNAERERLRGDLDVAIAHLEASIADAPEYIPSRMSLVRAYARAGRKSGELITRLVSPIPKDLSLVGAIPDDEELRALIERTWPGTSVPEDLPWYARDSTLGAYEGL